MELTTAEGAPGPIADLNAKAQGPDSALITWTAPANANGVISGYTLVYRLKSRGECGPRSAQPITKNVRSEKQLLDGLLPDSTYEIYVIAHTSKAGPQSETITVTTHEAGRRCLQKIVQHHRHAVQLRLEPRNMCASRR